MTAVLAVFAAAFSAFAACAYPVIAPRDSADLVATAMTLGVAHPPGYPLYSVLGRAWLAVLPWGGAAYRLNLLSAAAGAGAAAFLFAAVRRRSGTPAAALAAAVWAASAPLWKFSLLAESYALQACFAAVLLFLAEGGREDVFRRARLSGLLLGLGLVNHQSLLFLVPALLWLWRVEAGRRGVAPARLAAAAAGPAAGGLVLYAFLWIRLGSLGAALATALRLRYGAGTLFAGLAGPASPEVFGALAAYAARATAEAVSLPAAAAAAAGAALAWRADRARTAGWLLAGLGGWLFILLSRFDPSNWVAREVLEPALLLPCLAAAAFAGELAGALPRPAAAAAVLAAASVLPRLPAAHRNDFLAYDYVRDLRRAVPPGGALLLSGDTASFGLRWLGLVAPEAVPRETADEPLTDARGWLAARAGRTDVYVTGIGRARLGALGLSLAPAGLAQRAGGGPVSFPPSVLRRPSGDARDSYARNVLQSYAYASWLSARLLEERGDGPQELLDLSAVSADPEDYRLQ